ncbi:MAG TPA: hypothetical protein VK577_27640, partial [Bradyrhizobium sp.]|nr:hypothetical protein [Bradyrhizobium sp.]
IVLDTGNAYEKRDAAAAAEASRHPQGSAGWAVAMFPGARWVKAFNSVYFKTLETEAHRAGDKVGIPLASDDQVALDVAAQLVRDAGFDPVPIEPLSRGKEFEPGTRPYNTGMSGVANDPLEINCSGSALCVSSPARLSAVGTSFDNLSSSLSHPLQAEAPLGQKEDL